MGRPLGSTNKAPRADRGRPRSRPITWGGAISEGLKRSTARNTTAVCSGCGKGFIARRETARYCSPRCRYLAAVNQPDPFAAKARTLGSSLRLPDKFSAIASLLRSAYHKPCPYCGEFITLDNASVDHMEPIGNLRGSPLGRYLDRLENLQIVCRRCNGLKGDLSDLKYRKLLAFLRTDPDIYRRVMHRLADAKRAWALRKAKRRAE